ncbi:MAG: phosphoribosylformylglycinamidine synthase, partial [Rhodanobacteraceae bacterium]
MIAIDGQSALSPFRIDRLNAELARLVPGCVLRTAHFVYFVDPLPEHAPDLERLGQMLIAESDSARAATLWVIPRIGTVSPWSSKATDILQGCGVRIRRVERGTALDLDGMPAVGSESDVGHMLLAALHDPMTQEIVTSIKDADHLFDVGEPAPLERIMLGTDAVAALNAANTRLGLALASDEIEYLIRRYAALGRDPTDAELMMFAQANSEHCRHKIFNASWMIDGQSKEKSLFGMIRASYEASPD